MVLPRDLLKTSHIFQSSCLGILKTTSQATSNKIKSILCCKCRQVSLCFKALFQKTKEQQYFANLYISICFQEKKKNKKIKDCPEQNSRHYLFSAFHLLFLYDLPLGSISVILAALVLFFCCCFSLRYVNDNQDQTFKNFWSSSNSPVFFGCPDVAAVISGARSTGCEYLGALPSFLTRTLCHSICSIWVGAGQWCHNPFWELSLCLQNTDHKQHKKETEKHCIIVAKAPRPFQYSSKCFLFQCFSANRCI